MLDLWEFKNMERWVPTESVARCRSFCVSVSMHREARCSVYGKCPMVAIPLAECFRTISWRFVCWVSRMLMLTLWTFLTDQWEDFRPTQQINKTLVMSPILLLCLVLTSASQDVRDLVFDISLLSLKTRHKSSGTDSFLSFLHFTVSQNLCFS